VAEFLSESWIAELDRAAHDVPSLAAVGSPQPLVVEQRVRRGDREIVYHVSFTADGARVHLGSAVAPDLVIATDADTARRLHEGTLNAQQAAARRKLKIRGQVGRLRTVGEALRRLDDVFQTVRDATTYPAESGGAEGRR
jgi:SCP-2 sterol transfer family